MVCWLHGGVCLDTNLAISISGLLRGGVCLDTNLAISMCVVCLLHAWWCLSRYYVCVFDICVCVCVCQ